MTPAPNWAEVFSDPSSRRSSWAPRFVGPWAPRLAARLFSAPLGTRAVAFALPLPPRGQIASTHRCADIYVNRSGPHGSRPVNPFTWRLSREPSRTRLMGAFCSGHPVIGYRRRRAREDPSLMPPRISRLRQGIARWPVNRGSLNRRRDRNFDNPNVCSGTPTRWLGRGFPRATVRESPTSVRGFRPRA